MKTSTFLTKVLNKFHNGKSYTTTPNRQTWYGLSRDGVGDFTKVQKRTIAAKKGRNNLAGMLNKVAQDAGITTTKAKLVICNSLGHTSFDKFATSKNVKFSQVKAVLQAPIRAARQNGD